MNRHTLQTALTLAVLALSACSDPAPTSPTNDPMDDVGAPDASPDPTPDEPDTAEDVPQEDASPDPEPEGPLVMTSGGPVVGVSREGVRSFKGVPYAAPPVGDLRWRAPEPVVPWEEPRDAKVLGMFCRQPAALGSALTGDEDCLTLNVWTSDPAPRNAPVMVWLHGGGFVLGSGGEPLYDGTKLSDTGVVVVTINYRLGPLGFLALDGLADEDDVAVGNYGLLDQIAALEWVKQNIAAFGGNPDNVTIFGESAGAVSACLHLVTPASEGLFDRAILQSGPCVRDDFDDPQDVIAQGELLAETVGCGDAQDVPACMRALPMDDLVSALPVKQGIIIGDGVLWRPYQGGGLYPADIRGAIESGQVADVPVIIGHNGDEGTLFIALTRTEFTAEDYTRIIRDNYGDAADAIMDRYPLSDYDSPNDALAVISGDDLFVCGSRRTARALSQAGLPVFTYHFTRAVDFVLFPDLGAFHSSELLFVFHNSLYGTSLKTEERPLAEAIQRYWTRFALSGGPNGDDDVPWPIFDTDLDAHLRLDLQIEADSGLKADLCDFWDDAR